ncbi:hypothetical protein [Amycolatopsis sp. H20-H5]|uniref:hypothetical protein n=1 Tax=Amycolatopsis sp. H20-H5 TaxID=3046309 RepID=UPI002DBA0C8E|nr:hypothetical protein [Amycolatopsis sp. H20-H5]MEC3980868.1 hypothetical protein [Amycolatopsis sp. H20-H5]
MSASKRTRLGTWCWRVAFVAAMYVACTGVAFLLGADAPWASGTIGVGCGLGGLLVDGVHHRHTS